MSKKSISSKSETDWKKLDAMTDEEIDFSDCPEITPQQFAKSVVRRGLPVENNKHFGSAQCKQQTMIS